jgi:hypothetical protein
MHKANIVEPFQCLRAAAPRRSAPRYGDDEYRDRGARRSILMMLHIVGHPDDGEAPLPKLVLYAMSPS